MGPTSAAAVLAVLALLLAGPVPAFLSRRTAIRRAPRAATVLWQAVALAAVLSATGATLALSTGTGLGEGRGPVELVVAALALAVTVVVVGRLLLSGHLVGTRLRALRREHRRLVDLLGSPEGDHLVLEDETPVAYCLPGVLHGRVVVTRGAVVRLPEEQLAAVLAHERAHLHARHDLVLEAFTVLHSAFPRVVSSDRALAEVRLLVELLADAAARRQHGAVPLARALVTLADGPRVGAAAVPGRGTGAGVPATADAGLRSRVELLADDRSHRLLAAVLYTAAAVLLVVPTVFVAYPWLATLV
ncbi:M56 family metallopeptidase [Nocardioides caldifontis]|uniref:M56 family metallopeptidase n=1 Tax=Nocardioides caldifontis TaxID=2588938 RepID=UPI0011E03588|nr:M56 family metallopeptidase [Nocardioides caldifontis]